MEIFLSQNNQCSNIEGGGEADTFDSASILHRHILSLSVGTGAGGSKPLNGTVLKMTDYYLHGFTKLAAGNSKDFALAGNISELTSL